MKWVERVARKIGPQGKRVLEVGSYDVNGSVRPLFEGAKQYIGIDSRPGPGVDLVMSARSFVEDFKFLAEDFDFAESFDVVISINTIHNLALEDCKAALKEIQRVAKNGAFVTMDAFRTGQEKERMDAWNLTALTYMHVDEWVRVFSEVGYLGDYYWFIP